MKSKMKVALIIPCFNEEDIVLSLHAEISRTPFPENITVTPVFINDCSTDTTRRILIDNRMTFIDLPVNLGIGGAVQTGYKYALRNGYDIAVQMDGDGQHPPAELHKILKLITDGEADVAIGSRYLTKEGFQSSSLRRTGINYFKWLNKKLVGVTVCDSTSGYRALNRRALELAANYYPDEYPEPEAIVLYALNGLTIREAPVIMRERQGGQSSIRTYKTVYYMFKVTLGIIFLYIRLKFNGKRHLL
jgi:glycosyltransferase involved in cell wall biosynthesis